MGYYKRIIKCVCIFLTSYCLLYYTLQPLFHEEFLEETAPEVPKLVLTSSKVHEAILEVRMDVLTSSEAPKPVFAVTTTPEPSEPSTTPNTRNSTDEIQKFFAGSAEFTFFFNGTDQFDEKFLENITDTDGYLINTYYYPESKSMGDNGLAMVLLLNRNTMDDVLEYNLTLVASNETDEVVVFPELTKEVYDSCSFINVLAKTNVLPGMKKLEILDLESETRMEIPFRYPRKVSPSPVIICITPQFLSEQWQLFIIQAHVARRFGGHIHLSVISMIDTFYQLVKEYQKEGYVTLDYWIRPKFVNPTDSMDPNANVEWRNIGGGHTDCLLQYKESADFVTFFDLDDIFLPRGFDTYSAEFSVISVLNPTIRTFHYEKREFQIYRETQLRDIDFLEALGHPYYATDVMVGKAVARPRNLDSMWIHKSFNTRDEERLYLKHNFILHLQKPKEKGKIGNETEELEIMKVNFVEMKELMMKTEILEDLQRDFERMLSRPKIQSISANLQKDNFYLPLMYKCYHDRFYNLYNQSWTVQTKLCGNNEDCEIPQREDLKCVHSDADYVSGPRMSPITFHYHQNPRFNRKVYCSQ